MRRHASYFKLFLSVPPPTRKTRSSTNLPNEDTIDRTFFDHVKRMEKPGVYGDNLEIVAFARCYSVDVKIYQREFAYMVSGERDAGEESDDDGGGGSSMLGKEEPQIGERKVLHIAYHDWEHYSSVRNVDGPHKGLPNVNPKPLTEEGRKKQQEILEQGVVIMPWMEDVVERSLPGVMSKQKIREALEKSKGDVNLAVSRLLDDAEDANADAEGEKVAILEEDLGLDIGEPHPEKVEEKKKKAPQRKEPLQPPGKQIPKAGNKPKRETARERKERAQKEKVEKKKAKSGSGGATTSTASKDPKESASANPPTTNGGIKTLHV
ncbi:hypothetical protein TWF281_011368 [Arthrobotrys megalospora]